ncbi:hypothetical protein CHUV2995_00256 [Corynebacterium diphtheriae subsp. lausannense]|nr:hypothetical protein CHUV2995_00256 [Corynebacterium diphtheriae subsp. lausannense]
MDHDHEEEVGDKGEEDASNQGDHVEDGGVEYADEGGGDEDEEVLGAFDGAGDVGKVGEDGEDVFVCCFHAVGSHGECGGPDEEHGEGGEQDGGVVDDFFGVFVGCFAVVFCMLRQNWESAAS